MSTAKAENSSEGLQPEYQLDLLGEPCPYPAMQAVEAMNDLPAGKILEILTDCPQAFVAIPLDATNEGHELLRAPVRRGPETTFLFRTHL